jgi:hypothetical protein
MTQPNIRDLLLLQMPGVTADNIGKWKFLSPVPGDGVLRDATEPERLHPEMVGPARVVKLGPKSAIYCHKNQNKRKMITAFRHNITVWVQEGNEMQMKKVQEGRSIDILEDTWHAVACEKDCEFLVETSSDDKLINWEPAKYREKP